MLIVGNQDHLALGPTSKQALRVSVAPGADSVVTADLNYDFRTDVVVASPTGVVFARRQPEGGFTNVTREAALPAAMSGAAARAVWAADADTDGDLDIVLAPASGAPVLLRNNGDGTFAALTPFAGVPNARGFAWADLDGEGVPDAAFVDDAGRVHVQLNLRGGAFQADALPAAGGAVAAIAAVEATGDTTFDLVTLGNRRHPCGPHARRPGVDAARGHARRGRGRRAARLVVGDLDNNGAVDLIASRTMSSTVFLSGGPGQFAALDGPIGADVRAVADFGEDGRLELIAIAGGQAVVLNGKGTRDYGWQIVRPKAATATGDQRINSFGIGGSIEVRTGLHLQRVPIDAPIVHVGLGDGVGRRGDPHRAGRTACCSRSSIGRRRRPSRPASGSRGRVRGCSPGTAARWRS